MVPPGIQELIITIIIITLLSASGLWPRVIRGLRELRGEHFDDDPHASSSRPQTSSGDLDMCYRLLGLSPSASWDQVERAYKKKAKIHHPDLGGDEDTMRALNEAYTKLKSRYKHPK